MHTSHGIAHILGGCHTHTPGFNTGGSESLSECRGVGDDVRTVGPPLRF